STEGRAVSHDELAARVKQEASTLDAIEIRADRRAPHGAVVEVLDVARRHGVFRVGIATQNAGRGDGPAP
ncbi:MAG: biopolymer transporter ExbD, partial [Proteobacteria bacterium]|nr:biopolymer transporter ExbD [Pseudomonadota bacterium]